MVAISLYRGQLHRPPDVPREWPMPARAITLDQFRILTQRRALALSRQAHDNKKKNKKNDEEDDDDNLNLVADRKRYKSKELGSELGSEGGGGAQTPENCAEEEKSVEDGNEKKKKGSEEKVDADVKIEESKNLDNDCDTEKRKQELEKKLQVLNDKKHSLVQMLKQICNAEEEIKRRNAQSAVLRSSISLQAENAVDMSYATRHVPKLSVEVNFGSDSGAESDATANYHTQGRHMHHLHTTPPSTGPSTRPFHGPAHQNGLLPTPRSSLATLGHSHQSSMLMASGAAAATSSPSRFAPTGHRGLHHSSSLPPVSVPGAHFAASSASPAASGGASSVSRDARLTSSS